MIHHSISRDQIQTQTSTNTNKQKLFSLSHTLSDSFYYDIRKCVRNHVNEALPVLLRKTPLLKSSLRHKKFSFLSWVNG